MKLIKDDDLINALNEHKVVGRFNTIELIKNMPDATPKRMVSDYVYRDPIRYSGCSTCEHKDTCMDAYWSTSPKCNFYGKDIEPEWIDWTDYLPSADGLGLDPTEPYWNFECPYCHNHCLDEENPPARCPECWKELKR